MDIDLSTPEKALHLLENAYRAKNLELALACRNFDHEAELMLYHLAKNNSAKKDSEEYLSQPSTRSQLAEAIKAKWEQEGPPNFDGISSKISSAEHYDGKFYIVTESGRYPDGRGFSQRLFMSHQDNKWAVLCPASIYEKPRENKPWWAFWQ